jgi:hypothetical protein
LDKVNNSSLFCGNGILDFRLSFVIILEVSIMELMGFILLPAINRAMKNNIIRINGKETNSIVNKLFKTIAESSNDIATIRNPMIFVPWYNGT